MAATADLLDAVHEYAGLGLRVLPLHSIGADGRCTCDGKGKSCKPGKHPDGALVPHGLKDATTDVAVLRDWWTARPEANIGIATGSESKLVVLDADGPDGIETLQRLHVPTETWIAETGGGGRHQFFRHPGLVYIPSRAPVLTSLDVRADGGYVVVAPSRHVSGNLYRWTNAPSAGPLAPLPQDLLSLLLRRPSERMDANHVLTAGRRNAGLYRVGLGLVRRGLRGADLEAALLQVNHLRCRPPLAGAEVLEIAESLARSRAATAPTDIDARLAEIDAAWARAAWPGVSGTTDRITMRAVIDIAKTTGKTTIWLPRREVAEKASIDAATATRAMRRLTRSGWLRKRQRAIASNAAVYSLRVPDRTSSAPHRFSSLQSGALQGRKPPRVGEWCATGLPVAVQESGALQGRCGPEHDVLVRALGAHVHGEHDVWRRGGLGSMCLVCYGLLVALKEVSARDLAARLGRRKVKVFLTRLKAHGLATFAGGLWRPVMVGAEHLDRIAAQLGTLGKGAAQRQRHRQERVERGARKKGRAA